MLRRLKIVSDPLNFTNNLTISLIRRNCTNRVRHVKNTAQKIRTEIIIYDQRKSLT